MSALHASRCPDRPCPKCHDGQWVAVQSMGLAHSNVNCRLIGLDPAEADGPIIPRQPRCSRLNCRDGKPCPSCAKRHAESLTAEHCAWFAEHGHCGGCGQPGTFCLCTDRNPCGCRGLHEMGSGVGVDPVALFAEELGIEVSADQGELFA